ncbi:MAG: L-serine ammonia-lyase [Spirochaetia bacterium]
MISQDTILSLLKVGIGPSSSHTIGPMVMGNMFVRALLETDNLEDVDTLKITLYGSLSLTGRGHLSDVAIVLGLSGFEPGAIKTVEIKQTLDRIRGSHQIALGGHHHLLFNMDEIVFSEDFLSDHENGLTLCAVDAQGQILLEKTYFSIGGGFVQEQGADFSKCQDASTKKALAYDYQSAQELMQICKKEQCGIDEVVLRRDMQFLSEEEINRHLDQVIRVMRGALLEGLSEKNENGILPGPLELKRRAPSLYKILRKEAEEGKNEKDSLSALDWIGLFAMAVSEENAAGHRVVTAPTNGACGIIPAILVYYHQFHQQLKPEQFRKFLLTACGIGHLYRKNASISGAEAGCQAEIGVSSSMAAAGLCVLFGGSVEQVFSAAEIAMEHHLGMTCDPVGGLVQVPCIERNAFGATKAITAARMAMRRAGNPRVSLDEVIKTMYLTGKDMDRRYRETSLGGLATQVPCSGCR